VFAGVAGGSGLVGLLLMLWSGFELWRWRKRGQRGGADEAAWLIQGLIVLWVVRGQFTRDVLFSASFAVAFGLAIGLGIIADVPRVWRKPARPAGPLPVRTM
jgi:hypothetical protein